MGEDTIFHKIIRREIPAKILFEDESCIAIEDINPVAPVHVLIIPKPALPSLREAEAQHRDILGHLFLVASDLAVSLGVNESGYRLVINNGPDAQQTVAQLHVHLLGGRGFSWPPG